MTCRVHANAHRLQMNPPLEVCFSCVWGELDPSPRWEPLLSLSGVSAKWKEIAFLGD